MVRALMLGAMAFALSVVVGQPLVEFLRRRRLGKEISSDGPTSHMAKAGTPTMGGVLIFSMVLPITLAANIVERLSILLPPLDGEVLMDLERLKDPFPASDVEWRIARSGEKDGRVWAMCLAYITNRAIMERLDEVVGPDRWENEFGAAPGGGIVCGITVHTDDGRLSPSGTVPIRPRSRR